jgi:coproporphyrinogen III oxidase
MKKTSDHYFTNHHREGEMRGVSGIFFDHLNSGNLEADFQRVIDLSNNFIKSYFPILEKRYQENYTQEYEDFQLHRR